MYSNNELMFPHQSIAALRRLRGPHWQALVERVMTLPEVHEETLAFMLTMIRLNGCIGCENDSYRAMKGCTACAIQTLRRYKGEDEELLKAYQQALADVRQFGKNNPGQGIQFDSPNYETLPKQTDTA